MKNATPRHFNETADLTPDELRNVLGQAMAIKVREHAGLKEPSNILDKRAVAFLSTKQSLRTQASITQASAILGGQTAIFTGNSLVDETGKQRESFVDIGRCLDEMGYPVIFARTNTQQQIQDLMHASKRASIVNALCNKHHPLQSLADIEGFMLSAKDWKRPKITFMGDGNNVATSLAQATTMMGWDFVHGGPEERRIPDEEWEKIQRLAVETGGTAQWEINPEAAADGSDMIYADVFASMGEKSQEAKLAALLAPYKVTPEMMERAKSGAVFGHCLPKGKDEVSDEVMYGPQSIAFTIAGCRMDTTAAIIKHLLENR